MFTATATDICFKNKEMVTQCPIWFVIFSATTRTLSQIIQLQPLIKFKLKIITCVTAKRNNKSIVAFFYSVIAWNVKTEKWVEVMLAPLWKKWGIGSWMQASHFFP
jgi:hypothetical protein